MKTETFRQNYELTKGKGVRAVAKGSTGYSEAKTADGDIFNQENKYYFFDESTKKVRENIALRRVDNEYLGGFGLRVVKIENLRSDRRDALTDGQEFYKGEIAKMNELIQDFEREKDSK